MSEKSNLQALKSILQQADEHLVKEEYIEAEKSYKKLVTGLESLLGGQHEEVAEALHKLAAALHGQDRSEEALTVEERARVIHSAQENK